MNTKIDRRKKTALPRYSPEELEPREWAKDEAFIDSYVKRNRAPLNAAIERAREDFKQGKGVEIRSLDELHSALKSTTRRAKP